MKKWIIDELKRNIYIQVSSYVPVMSARDLAQELLIQHISELSNTKGFTTLKMWQEKIHKIGVTPINGKSIRYGIIELVLSETEAEQVYSTFTAVQPHSSHRTFEEAWQSFGVNGSMIEFVYFLTLIRRA